MGEDEETEDLVWQDAGSTQENTGDPEDVEMPPIIEENKTYSQVELTKAH